MASFSAADFRNGVPELMGRLKVKFGSYTGLAGGTGGDISTGLRRIYFMMLQPTGSSVGTNQPSINETFPIDGGDVTIVTDDGADGIWMAIGE